MFPTYVGLLGNNSTPYRSGIQSLTDGSHSFPGLFSRRNDLQPVLP